jgi:pimeloyl-ACP methyl ester carboxylesterase
MTKHQSIPLGLKMLAWIGRGLAGVLCLLLCLPMALLPKATAVPAWIWLPLGAASAALFSAQFLLKPAWKAVCVPLGGLLVCAILAVVVSQAFAATPPITDENGRPLAGSIAVLERVPLNGSQQWISMRGKDTSKPILLFLAGGPGGSQLSTERFALGGLEDDFVVVNWEQPGAGKSYDAVKRSTITVERYIEDAHALVLLLRERFGQDKVYLLGESWGSALGILLVQRYPELFAAFIGTGQMVAFTENDLICYNFAMDWARERGDGQKIAKLEKQGPPPYYEKDVAWKQLTYLADTYAYMNQNPQIADNGANTFRDLAAPEYGLYDKVAWFLGIVDTLGVVYPQLWDIDFRTQAAKLDVPVYFLIGRHDINAPVALTEEYYNLLEAPHKELVWFEHSGHNPWVSESARFMQVIRESVLAH